MKWKIIIVVVLLIGAAIGYKFYNDTVSAEQVQTYETAKVVRTDLTKTVSASGTIQPKNSVEVSSKITARVKEVLVEENEQVTAGQIVAILDGKDVEATRDQAQFTLTNAKQKLARIERLYNIGAKSLEELEDAQYNYDKAKTDLEKAETNVNETVITAPMSGIVVGEPLTAGSMAVQGNNNPTVILRIADLSEKLVKAKVDETDIGSIKIGERANFTVDAFPDENFSATVTKISQTDTANSWNSSSSSSTTTSSSSNSVIYYYVTFQAPDPQNLLMPAMTARLDIVVGQSPNALCVPIEAIKTDGKGSYVEKITKGAKGKDTAEKIYLTVGMYGEEYVEVNTDQLMAGDDVSVTYQATAKKSSSNSGRRMGGPPPF